MAQWVKALAGKYDYQSSIPGNTIGRREFTPQNCPLISTRSLWHVLLPNNQRLKNKQFIHLSNIYLLNVY